MSEKQQRVYITTTLPYVNAEPHIGHALEFIQADALARYFRIKLGKKNVFLNVGTDEYGLKVYQKGKDHEQGIQAYIEETAQKFKDFCSLFYVSYDSFYQTSHDYHKPTATEFWNKSFANGDIYKGKYEGYYCVGCEYYKTDKDLVDGKCPLHNSEPQWLSEENYFFKLSNYSDVILKYFEENSEFIKPKKELELMKRLIKSGLNDISISRQKEALPWGIPVPNDPDQVMYVWFDALSNYAGAVGFPNDMERFNEWWPVVQFCGPDNTRFQSVIWQAMLASAGLPFSKNILVHGYILGPDGRKMSKTIGNVVSPFDQAEKFSPEIVRYYLLAGLATFADASYKEDDLINLYNSNLADKYGNLVNRTIVLAEKKSVKLDIDAVSAEFKATVDEIVKKAEHAYDNSEIYEACEHANSLVVYGNKYFNDEKPWEADKDSAQLLNNIYYLLLEATRLYEPIVPISAGKAREALEKQESVILFKKLEVEASE